MLTAAHIATESCNGQQPFVAFILATMQPMVVSKSAARADFAKRLNKALVRVGLLDEAAKKAWLAKRCGISGEAARKWLAGLTMPTMARMNGLANDLGVRAPWLMSGEPPMVAGDTVPPSAQEDPAPYDTQSAEIQELMRQLVENPEALATVKSVLALPDDQRRALKILFPDQEPIRRRRKSA
jgi:transcriptional regulator with XRE-family HTH domain